MVQVPEREWLDKAQRVARRYKATTRGARGAGHSVYVLLLHAGRRSESWGLYVGQTARDPDLRFDQHKAGYKSKRRRSPLWCSPAA